MAEWSLYSDDAAFLKSIGIDGAKTAEELSTYAPISKIDDKLRDALARPEPLARKLDRLADQVLFADSEGKRFTALAYGIALAYLLRATDKTDEQSNSIISRANWAIHYDKTGAAVIAPRDICDTYRELCPDAYRERFGDDL